MDLNTIRFNSTGLADPAPLLWLIRQSSTTVAAAGGEGVCTCAQELAAVQEQLREVQAELADQIQDNYDAIRHIQRWDKCTRSWKFDILDAKVWKTESGTN